MGDGAWGLGEGGWNFLVLLELQKFWRRSKSDPRLRVWRVFAPVVATFLPIDSRFFTRKDPTFFVRKTGSVSVASRVDIKGKGRGMARETAAALIVATFLPNNFRIHFKNYPKKPYFFLI